MIRTSTESEAQGAPPVPGVSCDGREVTVRGAGVDFRQPLTSLPTSFLQWQVQARLQAFDKLLGDSVPAFLHAHLPVVATLDGGGPFPVNLSNKGVGLCPPDENIERHLEPMRLALREAERNGWRTSLPGRIEAAVAFYSTPLNFDPRRLVGLEIFVGRTFENLRRDPRASLLFTGPGPAYPSYQVDCVVEIVSPGDPRYEFALAMRQLFAHDPFHVRQTAYPHGYVFWVCGITDKRPRPGPDRGRTA